MTALKIEQILNLSPITLVNGEEVWHADTFICKVESTSSWRMKYILEEDGLLVPVNSFVEQIGGLAYYAWMHSLEIDRVSFTIEAARIELNESHEYVNELFTRAKEIQL